MSKPISSYPEEQREAVIMRRLKSTDRGLGYLAAVDAQLKLERSKKQANKK